MNDPDAFLTPEDRALIAECEAREKEIAKAGHTGNRLPDGSIDIPCEVSDGGGLTDQRKQRDPVFEFYVSDRGGCWGTMAVRAKTEDVARTRILEELKTEDVARGLGSLDYASVELTLMGSTISGFRIKTQQP